MMEIFMKAFSTCFTRTTSRAAAGQRALFSMDNRHTVDDEDKA
jgi:hypothetical protein